MTTSSPDPRSARQALRPNAKRMRAEPTAAEARFWHYARNRGIGGLKFRRQVPLAGHIVDFLCTEHRIIAEIDGGQHAGRAADKKRDAHLAALGYTVLRFWNSDVLNDMNAVAETILAARKPPRKDPLT
ncbi:MAG: endonuclease domain-containing protein [Aestuariivirga sp.]|uniref:endonuclease domain-containing protein n=1 Tax=Aestuariivirga sp. TaxID=2650926 RepID=UPI0038D18F25